MPSAAQTAARNGDLPQPRGLDRTARDFTRPHVSGSISYRRTRNSICSWVGTNGTGSSASGASRYAVIQSATS